MKSGIVLSLTFAAAALAAACGGSSRAPVTPPPSSGGDGGAVPAGGLADDPATPFAEPAVQAALAATAGVEACGVDAATTMGAHFATQREALVGGGDGGNAVDESFACTAQEDGRWQCEWSVFTRPSAPDPEDPCAGEGGSGYIIIAEVGADGVVAPGKIYCNAPG